MHTSSLLNVFAIEVHPREGKVAMDRTVSKWWGLVEYGTNILPGVD